MDLAEQTDVVAPEQNSLKAVATEETGDRPKLIRLPRLARGWRVILLLVLAVLFLAGTTVGSDKWWPFGPWSMYASSTKPSASVVSMAIQVRIGDDPQWQNADLELNSVGLNRAEVEGRMSQILADPAMLGTLATTHARLRPHDPPWRAVRVVRNEVLLSHGAPTGELRTTPLASWGDS